MLEVEVNRNPDSERRRDVAVLFPFANAIVFPRQAEAARAETLEKLAFGAFDALHLPCAEQGGVDVFLTTDDDLLRRARRHAAALRIRVANPVSWYHEVTR